MPNKIFNVLSVIMLSVSSLFAYQWTSGTVTNINLHNYVTSYNYRTQPGVQVNTVSNVNVSVCQVRLSSGTVFAFILDGSTTPATWFQWLKEAKLSGKTISIFDGTGTLEWKETAPDGTSTGGNSNRWVWMVSLD